LTFIFRFLLHKNIASNEAYREGFEKALRAALEEHGLGAKTAIGHGRFSKNSWVSDSQRETNVTEAIKEKTSLSAMKSEEPTPHRETWDKANLTWNPGNMTLTATSGDKKATCKEKDLIPEIFHKKLFEKRKSVTAIVEVEPVGGKKYRIIKIE
jgi:CRISPR-associated protein Cmr6